MKYDLESISELCGELNLALVTPDDLFDQAQRVLSALLADRDALLADRDCWRRVAERLESEKLDAIARAETAEARAENLTADNNEVSKQALVQRRRAERAEDELRVVRTDIFDTYKPRMEAAEARLAALDSAGQREERLRAQLREAKMLAEFAPLPAHVWPARDRLIADIDAALSQPAQEDNSRG